MTPPTFLLSTQSTFSRSLHEQHSYNNQTQPAMAEGGRSRKNDGRQYDRDVPARQRTGADAGHHVDSRHGSQQLRQFKRTFIDDIERAISGGKEFRWDWRSRAIWEEQMWELNSMTMEGSTSAIQEALLDLRNRFLQPYITHLENELDNVHLGSRDKNKVNSELSRLKEEYEMTKKCEDAKEFFAWYFSRAAQEEPDNDSLRGRGKNLGRDIRNTSRKGTPSGTRDSSRDPYSGEQTRSFSPSTSIRSQSTIGDSRAGSISGRGLESTPLSEYDHQKYMVDTYIEILKTQIQTARNRKWICKTHSAETGIIRERYLWQYWETIKSDLQEIRYDDDLFLETVEEAWTEYLESYKIQLLKERKSYETLPGVQVHLQRYDTRIKHLEDELSVIRKSGIYKAFDQFQSSEDTSAYEPRTGNRDSHQDTRHVFGVAKEYTKSAQPRSPTPDRFRKIDANTKHTASLDPKRLKDECTKYTNDCDKIAKDSLVCWERGVMKTGNEQIKKLNEIDPDSEAFYKKLGPVMSQFINWFIENANKELKSIEQRAKKHRNILETHRDVKNTLNELIKQGTQLLSKLQSLSR